MYPIVWSLGKINIYSHGLMVAAGAVVGGFLLYVLARRKNLPIYFILDLCLLSMLGGLVGARLLYFFLYLDQFTYWYEVFFIWQGGLVSFGGFLGALLVAAFYLKNKNQAVWQWFDLGIGPLLVGWAIGRIGCFLTGDVIGTFSSSRWAINGQWPVALFEAIWLLIVAGICLMLAIQKKFSFKKGLIFNLGLGLYGVGRLMIDFLRVDSVLGSIKWSQIGDLLVITLAIIFILVVNVRVERSQYVGSINE